MLHSAKPNPTACDPSSKLLSECAGRRAFRLAYLDRERTTLTVDELVSFKWFFRFKQEAGPRWMQIDPFWNLDSDSDDDNAFDQLDGEENEQVC